MKKDEIILGQRFGSYIVVSEVDTKDNEERQWNCLCDCGEIFVYSDHRIRNNGRAKSCPKCSKKMSQKNRVKNLDGQRFGALTVICSEEHEGHIRQKCLCDCGNIKYTSTNFLKRGLIKSCGCKNPIIHSQEKEIRRQLAKQNIKDICGNRYGRLLVVDYDFENKKWRCKCDCGNEVEVMRGNLIYGKQISCGCYSKEMLSLRNFVDLTGKRFGQLIVLEEAEGRKINHRSSWLCKCDCGETKIISGNSLVSGKTISCGCINSKGELKIKKFLDDNNIKYQQQKSFIGLKGTGNKCLTYDFYLPDYNVLIEYQGEQHYKPIEHFGGEEHYNRQIEHDKRKRQYAQNNNYLLIEISYLQNYNDIELIIMNAIKFIQMDKKFPKILYHPLYGAID